MRGKISKKVKTQEKKLTKEQRTRQNREILWVGLTLFLTNSNSRWGSTCENFWTHLPKNALTKLKSFWKKHQTTHRNHWAKLKTVWHQGSEVTLLGGNVTSRTMLRHAFENFAPVFSKSNRKVSEFWMMTVYLFFKSLKKIVPGCLDCSLRFEFSSETFLDRVGNTKIFAKLFPEGVFTFVYRITRQTQRQKTLKTNTKLYTTSQHSASLTRFSYCFLDNRLNGVAINTATPIEYYKRTKVCFWT